MRGASTLAPGARACTPRRRGNDASDEDLLPELWPMSAMDASADQPAAARAAAKTRAPAATKYISWIALAMMTTSSVASPRAAPTMAVYGLACVFLYIVPAIVFRLPTSRLAPELAWGYERCGHSC